MLIIPDAQRDERFSRNPLVTGSPYIRFYAGTSLRAPNGSRMGTLCAIDTLPRSGLTRGQISVMENLAAETIEANGATLCRPVASEPLTPVIQLALALYGSLEKQVDDESGYRKGTALTIG